MGKNYNLAGTACWAKIQGDPQENYQGDANEWSIDVTPDQRGLDLIRRLGLGEKLRNKDDDREDFITFRRRELKKDGTENNKVEVVGADGEPWPEDQQIGNGTKVKIKFSVFEAPAKGKFKAIIKPVIYKVTIVEYVAPPAPKPKLGKKTAGAPSNKPAAKGKAWEEAAEEEGDE